MTEADILGSDFLVQAGCEDHATLEKAREDVRWDQALRQIHGSHAVGLVLRLGSELLQTQLGDSGLDAVRHLSVYGEALGHGARGDLGQAGVQGVDELRGRGGEVGGLEVLVVLHDRQPVPNGSIVRGRRGLARLDGLDSAGRPHQDTQTRWGTDGLLATGQDDVDIPRIEGDLLAPNAANTVDGDEGLRADTAHKLGYGLDVVEHTGRGISVGHGNELVGLLLEGFLNLS